MSAVVTDLHDVIDRALSRGAHLLTAGEHIVVARMRRLTGPAAIAYARLTTRVPEVFEVARLTIADVVDVPDALATLRQAELVDGVVTWTDRARALRKDDLVAATRRLGLATGGRREHLLERLRPHRGFTEAPFVRVRHRGLVRRLERWAFLKPFPERATLVMERMGVVRWPTYPLTNGRALPMDRRTWKAYERLVEGLGATGTPLSPSQALEALRDGTARAAGRLDLTRRLQRELVALGHALEREGRRADAIAIYEQLVELGTPPWRIAFRYSQALAGDNHVQEGFDVLAAARAGAPPAERMAIVRGLRRLARRLSRSVAPDPPLQPPRRRELRLARHAKATRARWGDDRQTVEAAVCRWLGEQGRKARFGEGRPFGTLFALLFADVLFLPVPGALPVRGLSGPLDFGTPAFRSARRDAIDEVFAGLDRGEAATRVRHAWDRHFGTRILGARWDHSSVTEIEMLAQHLGPQGLRAILDPLIDYGLGARAGLPDLVVWPGPTVRLPDALPSRLSTELCLAEIKAPGDRLQDRQRIWLDRLVRAGVRAEVWDVTASPEHSDSAESEAGRSTL